MSLRPRLYALWNTHESRWNYIGNDAGGLHEIWAFDDPDSAEDARQNMIEPDDWKVIELEARNA